MFADDIDNLIKYALMSGISYEKFWGYSIFEIQLIIDAYCENKKANLKEQAQFSYVNAKLIGSIMCGNTIPNIEEIYPSLFEYKAETKQEDVALMKAKMMRYYNAYNTKREV